MNKKNKNSKGFYFTDALMIRVFFVVLIIGMIIALIPALRPEYSETEKRELNKFPKFTFESLVSGDFFDDINLWYADTFPFRDSLISINSLLRGSLNIDNSIEIHGDISVGDDIPDVNANINNNSSNNASSNNNSSNNTSSNNNSSVVTPPVATSETLGAIIRVGDTAFEYYDFVQRIADNYASHISYAADTLKGKATVYSIIAPTSMGITLPDKMMNSVNSSNQKAAMEYMYSKMSGNVVKVNPYNTLRNHKNEYIYFRTDHHWTALGAYYTYCDLMKTKGVTPPKLNDFIKREFSGYLGSFYNQTKSPYLAENPDTVVAYEPVWTNTIKTTIDANTILDKKIVSDGNTLTKSNKYLCFVSGDRPYGVVNNPNLNDGSSCLVIKESFGNAMISFFVANYQTVHVIDYRHFAAVDGRKLSQFVTDNAIQDVVFVNNISATRNDALVNTLGSFVREE